MGRGGGSIVPKLIKTFYATRESNLLYAAAARLIDCFGRSIRGDSSDAHQEKTRWAMICLEESAP